MPQEEGWQISCTHLWHLPLVAGHRKQGCPLHVIRDVINAQLGRHQLGALAEQAGIEHRQT